MDRYTEAATNLTALRRYMAQEDFYRIVLSRHGNLAWAGGGGRSYVSRGSDRGDALLLVGREDVLLVTSNVEAKRLEAEEFAGLGWQVVPYPWWEGPQNTLARLITPNMRVGADAPLPVPARATDIGPKLTELRSVLTFAARTRARALGRDVGEVLAAVSRTVEQGEAEQAIAGRLTGALEARGMDVPVVLVGVDERVYAWRHFLPTERRLERYAALVVCARRDGLIISATRLIHFGTPPDDLLRRLDAVQRVDAALIAATRPGAVAADLLAIARRTYTEAGFPDEWQNHHQGGAAGYELREWTAVPEGPQAVRVGQLYTWNATVPGAKSEDTILVGEEKNEILTFTVDFPFTEIAAGGTVVPRPGILIR